MPYNVIDTTYIARYKINSNTEIEVFYKDKKLVSVSEVYKVQYNSNGIIRQLIGNDIKMEYKCNTIYYYYEDNSILDIDSIDILKDGIIVDISDDDDDDEDDEDDDDDDDDDDDIPSYNEEEAKKKHMTGYYLYIRENIDSLKKELCIGDVKSKNTEALKKMALMFKSLSYEERINWNERAKKCYIGKDGEIIET